MVKQEGKDRRRSVRNKTIVINYKHNPDELPSKTIQVNEGYNDKETAMLPDMQQRTFCFSDLITAFQTIEKRGACGISAFDDVLKRFKTDEEVLHVNDIKHEKMNVESEIFPKIFDNPFLRSDKQKRFRES